MCSLEDTREDDNTRRSNKPLMEKRRRQRINRCLNDLKTLVLEALKKDPSRYSKLEKADILEMTVRHVQALHRHDLAGVRGRATGGDEKGKYRAGFTQCAVEVTRYLANMGGNVPHDLQTKVIAHLNSVTKSLMGQPAGVSAGSGLVPGSSSVVVGGGVVTLTPTTPSSSSSSAPVAPPLTVTTVADSSTALVGLAERPSGTAGDMPFRRPAPGDPALVDAASTQGPVTVGAGVTLVPARLASGQVALVLPPGTTLPTFDAPPLPPTGESSLESTAPHSTSFGVPSRLGDSSSADYSSTSFSNQLSSNSSFGGPRLVTLASRPQEGYLYSVSEAASAPFTTGFKSSSGFADALSPSFLPPPPPLLPLSEDDASPALDVIQETAFPPPPSGREQGLSFLSAETGGQALSVKGSQGVGEVRLASSEASGETCPRLVPFHPSPGLKISVSFSDSSKTETRRTSSYPNLYPDPTTGAQVVRPTPTLPESVVLTSPRPDHAQGTPSLYHLHPDGSCSVQPPAATSFKSPFVTVVSSSTTSSSASVSFSPNASSASIVSSTSGAPSSLSISTAPSVPSILYVSSTPSVLSAPSIPSNSIPIKPSVPPTPTVPGTPYPPSTHSTLPSSTIESTFSLSSMITFTPSSLASSPPTALPSTSSIPSTQVTSSSITPSSSSVQPSPSIPSNNAWSESGTLRTPISSPTSSLENESSPITGLPDTHVVLAPLPPTSATPTTHSPSSTTSTKSSYGAQGASAATLPVPDTQCPSASSSSSAPVNLGAPSVPTSATPESATPSAEPLNLVTNNQSRDLACGKRPFSLKMAPTPTWRRSSAPYRPPVAGRRSQPWRPW
ncbi:flocculation protein FLO11-like [Penaeus japonicus]|uniref:flocculation protein FLO11-like n=1 Tax=Penaeus japonicus TaxID=27405 RepID=UPI001C70F28C|nr:flocculation protein FLO11-like [Penaeus japonicus]